jgi:hypothetical protein
VIFSFGVNIAKNLEVADKLAIFATLSYVL